MTPQHNVILSKLAESKFDKLIHSDRKLGEQVAKAIDRVASNPDLGELLRRMERPSQISNWPLSNHLPH